MDRNVVGVVLSFVTGSSRFRESKKPPEEDVERALERLCTPPWDSQWGRYTKLPAAAFNDIRDLLSYNRDPLKQREWSKRPRIFAILQNIKRLDAMSDFVNSQYLDDMLPFNEHELPPNLGKSRSSFVRFQPLCLTEAIELEKGDGKHVQFGESGDMHFLKMRELGSGAFGRVDVVWSRLSLRYYARKKFRRSYNAQQTLQQFNWYAREIGALKRLSHRHLVKIKGTYTDPNCFAFLMKPVAEYNLQEYLTSIQKERLPNIRYFYGCLASAISYLHDAKIYHMDIKLVNILVKDHQIYVTDFGAAHDWSQRDRSTTWAALPRTYRYMPPEQASDAYAPKNYAIDIWSLGVVFLEMTTVLKGSRLRDMYSYLSSHGTKGEFIYNNSTATTQWLEVLRDRDGRDLDNLPLIWVKDMLARDPQNRPYARGIRGQILDADGFCGMCCVDDDEHHWNMPGGLDNKTESVSDGNSVAEFFDAPEIHAKGNTRVAGSADDLDARTIRPSVNSTKITSSKDSTNQVSDDELPFDIESDNDEDHVPSQNQLQFNVQVLPDPIPNRLMNIELFAEVRSQVAQPQARSVKAEEDQSSEFEAENTSLFDVESDGSNSSESFEVVLSEEMLSHVQGVTSQQLILAEQYKGKLATVEEAEEDDDDENEDTAYCDAEPLLMIDTITDMSLTVIPSSKSMNNAQIEGRATPHQDEMTPVKGGPRGARMLQWKSEPPSSTQRIDSDNARSSQMPEVTDTPNVVAKQAPTTRPLQLTANNLRKLQEGKEEKEPKQNLFSNGRRITRLTRRVSAKRFIQDACRPPDIEVATTVMTEQTRAELKKLVAIGWMNASTPILETYVRRGGVAAVRTLLNSGCNPGTKKKPDAGPLRAAVKGASLRHNKCAEALLKAGANPNAKTSRTGKSMLALAVENQYFPGYRGLIWTLLHWGADPNVKDKNGDYPLLQILYNGYEPLEEHKREALALVLEQSHHRTDVNVEPPGTLNMPLHYAVRRKDPYAVGILLEKGARPNSKNGAGQTPLAVAVNTWGPSMSDDHKEVVRLLLSRGANVNEPLGASKAPALLSATQHKHPDLVELLIRYGADPAHTDTNGQNARMLCDKLLTDKKISNTLATEIKSLLELGHDVDWDSDRSSVDRIKEKAKIKAR